MGKVGTLPSRSSQTRRYCNVGCVTGMNGLRGLAIGLVNVIYGAGMDKMLQYASVARGQGS